MGDVVYGWHANRYGAANQSSQPTTNLHSDEDVAREQAQDASRRSEVSSAVVTAYHVDHEGGETPARWLVAQYLDGRDTSSERYTSEQRHEHAHDGPPSEPRRSPSTQLRPPRGH